MKINLQWLKQHEACREGQELFAENFQEAEVEDVLRALAGGERWDWFWWLFSQADLATIPGGVKLTGNVEVYNCANFIGFPEGFTAQGNVWVDNCPKFTGFPEGFTAQGDVRVNSCPKYKEVLK